MHFSSLPIPSCLNLKNHKWDCRWCSGIIMLWWCCCWRSLTAVCVRRFNGQRHGRFDLDDHIHRVSNGLHLPGLHSLLRPEGLLHHLCDHIRTELHLVCAELQATGLLERSLETTASSQEGLDKKTREDDNIETSGGEILKPLKIVTCHQKTLLPNKCSFCCVCITNEKIKQGKKNVIFRGHRSQVYCIARKDLTTETQISV